MSNRHNEAFALANTMFSYVAASIAPLAAQNYFPNIRDEELHRCRATHWYITLRYRASLSPCSSHRLLSQARTVWPQIFFLCSLKPLVAHTSQDRVRVAANGITSPCTTNGGNYWDPVVIEDAFKGRIASAQSKMEGSCPAGGCCHTTIKSFTRDGTVLAHIPLDELWLTMEPPAPALGVFQGSCLRSNPASAAQFFLKIAAEGVANFAGVRSPLRVCLLPF